MEEPEVPMILPKGIVINTPNIYDEVAKCPQVPTDKAWEYWRVYTTTNKRLQDPTARRLENFWWHVIGSDRQHLSGHVLARLYEDISLGPTFVPLRGPPNRWEGPDVPPIAQIQLEKTGQATSHTSSSGTMSTPNMRMSKDLSSSALRPPPPHPILKKPRGPSASGPRPTARFVSPHVSGDEEEKEDDIPSSGSTITPGLEMRAAMKSPPKKKAPAANRKFVASAGKRRPALTRKGSSYSAGGPSGGGSKEGGNSTSGVKSPKSPKSPRSFPRVISPIDEALSTLSNGPSPASEETPKLSSKALGKRPAVPRNAKFEPKYCQKEPEKNEVQPISSPKAQTPRSLSITPTQTQTQVQTQAPTQTQTQIQTQKQKQKQKKQAPAPLTRHLSLVELPSQTEMNRGSPKQGKVDTDSASRFNKSVGSVPMAPSRSHSGFVRREKGINHGLFTGATASTTNIAAQGTIIDQSGSVGPVPIPSPYEYSPYDEMSASPSSSLLASRLTPTQPSTAASVPLGRTRSQLTLLLERGNDQPRKKSWY